MGGTIRHWKTAAAAIMAAAGLFAVALGSQGLACGYDDPQSVSRGSLNWSYPNALYVIGAISREVAARRLPLANFDRGGVDLFGRKFKLAATSLEQFGAMLGAAPSRSLQTSVAVVLVEPMLWARFEPTDDGWRIAVHVSGPGRGDLVMVTGEAVISEIAARHLTFRQAYARGIVRLYGEDAQIAAFVQNYQQVGARQNTADTAGVRGSDPDRIATDTSTASPHASQPGTTAVESDMFGKPVQ